MGKNRILLNSKKKKIRAFVLIFGKEKTEITIYFIGVKKRYEINKKFKH